MEHRVEEISLNNGAKGLLIDVAHAPVMSFDFAYRAGYFTAPEQKWDVPHVLEHVLLGANKKYPKSRLFNAQLEKNGAYSNGTTAYQRVHYVAECADFEWDRILGLMSAALTQPLMLENEFTAELSNVREELSGNLNNYFRLLGTTLSQSMGMPILTDGERLAQLPTITLADIKKHYANTHTSDNLRFIIAGKIRGRKTKIRKALNQLLKPLPRGNFIELPTETTSRLDGPLYIHKPDVEKLHFYLDIYHNERISNQQSDALWVLNAMLTGTLHALILGEARDRGLAYGMSSDHVRGHTQTSWWFGTNVTNENAVELMKLVYQQLQKILDGDMLDADIESAKQFVLGRFQRRNQRVIDISNGYSGRYFYNGEIDDFAAIPEQIKAVDKASVKEVAQIMMQDNTWGLGVLGNADEELAQELYKVIAPLWGHTKS